MQHTFNKLKTYKHFKDSSRYTGDLIKADCKSLMDSFLKFTAQ